MRTLCAPCSSCALRETSVSADAKFVVQGSDLVFHRHAARTARPSFLVRFTPPLQRLFFSFLDLPERAVASTSLLFDLVQGSIGRTLSILSAGRPVRLLCAVRVCTEWAAHGLGSSEYMLRGEALLASVAGLLVAAQQLCDAWSPSLLSCVSQC
jgi:hypothetical protein